MFDIFDSVDPYDGDCNRILPYSEEELKQIKEAALKEQQDSFLLMFRNKLEYPEKPLKYSPGYLR